MDDCHVHQDFYDDDVVGSWPGSTKEWLPALCLWGTGFPGTQGTTGVRLGPQHIKICVQPFEPSLSKLTRLNICGERRDFWRYRTRLVEWRSKKESRGCLPVLFPVCLLARSSCFVCAWWGNVAPNWICWVAVFYWKVVPLTVSLLLVSVKNKLLVGKIQLNVFRPNICSFVSFMYFGGDIWC